MANYQAVGRSNYYRVKDPAAFARFCERWDVVLIEKGSHEKELPADGLYGWYCEFGVPSSTREGWDDEEEEEEEVEAMTTEADPPSEEPDFQLELAEQLAPGEIAVVVEAGHERARYVSGWGWAVDHEGETVGLDMQTELYARVKQRWPDAAVTDASY
jgi:hypothetical protein